MIVKDTLLHKFFLDQLIFVLIKRGIRLHVKKKWQDSIICHSE